MSKKTLFMHIGAGKTGTSSLQSQLALNRQKLEEYHYYYPVSTTDKKAINFEITSGNAIELGQILSSDDFSERRLKNIVSKYIKKAQGNDIILSSEVLENYNEDAT